MQGNPLDPAGCKHQCTRQGDCPLNEACVRNKCIDPCPGTCGINAQCTVENHNPICSCPTSYSGNPFVRCTVPPVAPVENDPCNPSPCGRNTICTVLDGGPVCECMADYIGNANIACNPGCVLNSNCPNNQACVKRKCVDPCPGTCGAFADCRVSNHRAVCTCIPGYEGDPFRRCYPSQDPPPPPPKPFEPSCYPNPCGPNSKCEMEGPRPVCSCLPGFFGKPTNCHPECTSSSNCDNWLACINGRCVDPCRGICGANTFCNVVDHNPICECSPGFTGDPFSNCYRIPPPPGRTNALDFRYKLINLIATTLNINLTLNT